MWTKLGDEWSAEARDLSDAAYRTHVDSLCWSNERLLDLYIPKRDLRRFAETADPDTAVKELIAAGWWRDDGDTWYVGLRFPDWQVESTVVKARQQQTAERVRRHRRHLVGDHSLCRPQSCNALRNALRDALPGTGRDGAGTGTYESENNDGGERDDGWPDLAPIPGGDDGLTPQQRAVEAARARQAERRRQQEAAR